MPRMKPSLVSLASGLILMAGAEVASAQQAVILVRHAELSSVPTVDPRSLPISEAGEERARHLADFLRDSGVTAIYVTDFERTIATAQPLAREIHKEPTVVAKSDPRELMERIRKDHAGETVLLVGHTDTIPGLLKALGYPADVRIGREDFSNLFVAIPKGEGPPTVLRFRY
jgi:broad specificity phosphatase PhoE